MKQSERQTMVVIDEAHEMSENILLELRLKKYEAISQRIGIQYHLSGISQEETSAYVKALYGRGQAKATGVCRERGADVYAASQGIPRVVNQICSQSLFKAESNDAEVIEETQIGRVLADMDRQRGTTG